MARTLGEELEHLERTNPAVAKAAANYDRMAWRLTKAGPILRGPKRRFTGKGPTRKDH